MKVSKATKAEHPKLLAIAKQSPFTSGFSNIHYSGDSAYEKGWIGVARDDDGEPVGFVCVRHLQREPYTSLYYMGVKPEYRGKGVGRALIEWVWKHSPHREIRLLCERKNPAVQFYLRLGFEKTGMGTNSKGVEHYTFSLFR